MFSPGSKENPINLNLELAKDQNCVLTFPHDQNTTTKIKNSQDTDVLVTIHLTNPEKKEPVVMEYKLPAGQILKMKIKNGKFEAKLKDPELKAPEPKPRGIHKPGPHGS